MLKRSSWLCALVLSLFAATPAVSVFALDAAANGATQTFGFSPLIDEYRVYPSDAAGAVSANYVVTASNGGIVMHGRDGVLLQKNLPQSFWADIQLDANAIYDQHIVYDKNANRFVIIGLADKSLKKGTLLVAVSDPQSPTLPWTRYYIPIGSSSETGDFISIAQTVDSVVATTNVFDGESFEGSRVYVFKKDALYATPATVSFTTADAPFDAFIVPVTNYDDANIYFLAREEVVPDRALFFRQVVGSTVVNKGGIVTTSNPSFNDVELFDTLIAPQAGTNDKMDCGYPQIYTATLRRGNIWIAEGGFMPSPTRAVVRWWRAPIASPENATSGIIEDASGKRQFAFPSLAVNSTGSVLLGYSLFDAAMFPSAGYTYIDAAGNASAPVVLKEGEAAYNIPRWADFSTTVVDPTNDLDFWTAQTYAIDFSEPGKPTRWAMWWGKIVVSKTSRFRAVRH